MTDDQLTAMAALEEKATKGPWLVSDATVAHCPEWDAVPDEDRERYANRRFIAAARQFVPDAIAEIRRLRAMVRSSYEEGAVGGRLDTASWVDSKAKRAMESDGDYGGCACAID